MKRWVALGGWLLCSACGSGGSVAQPGQVSACAAPTEVACPSAIDYAAEVRLPGVPVTALVVEVCINDLCAAQAATSGPVPGSAHCDTVGPIRSVCTLTTARSDPDSVSIRLQLADPMFVLQAGDVLRLRLLQSPGRVLFTDERSIQGFVDVATDPPCGKPCRTARF